MSLFGVTFNVHNTQVPEATPWISVEVSAICAYPQGNNISSENYYSGYNIASGYTGTKQIYKSRKILKIS